MGCTGIFREGGGGQISILKIIGGGGGGHTNFLFSMNITTATSISAYMDLLATRSVQVHESIWVQLSSCKAGSTSITGS